MIQTSTRAADRRAYAARRRAVARPTYYRTHPEGNRATRLKQAKLDRTEASRKRKWGASVHRLNVSKSKAEGLRQRIAKIQDRELSRENYHHLP